MIEPNQVYLGDCLEVMADIEDQSIDLILTDPPYFKVLKEEWDNQWADADDFISWIGAFCGHWHRILKHNGSIYCFTSSTMSARVEMKIAETFNVLNNIVWDKGESRKGAAGSGVDVTALRKYWSSGSERIIFAEHHGSDCDYDGAIVDENSTYWEACEGAKVSTIGSYLKSEFSRAGVESNKEIAALFPSKTGRLTGCVSNWLTGANFPTSDQYEKIRHHLNTRCSRGDFLRKEYEDLRKEYEDLRKEYEDLRRPFHLDKSMEWGELWRFPISRNLSCHPCEKPINMMEHIIKASSDPGDVVLDCFLGSGSTAIAASNTGRNYIGIEKDKDYYELAKKRIDRETRQERLF